MIMRYIMLSLFTMCFSINAFAVNNYTQSIHVVNLLANTSLPEVGMTGTPVIVNYFNGNSYPCWTTTLHFREDTTVHAGEAWMGCVAKINQVVVQPLLVVNKLKTYLGSDSVDIDTRKYATHLTIVQLDTPRFDELTGLVSHSGSLKVQAHAD